MSSKKKRAAPHSDAARAAPSSAAAAAARDADSVELEFEDAYADQFIEEERVAGGDDSDDGDYDDDEEDMEVVDDGADDAAAAAAAACAAPALKRAWRPGIDALGEDEELTYDPTAYKMYHALRPQWPCLSVAMLRDQLGEKRSKFPHSLYCVAGTQAGSADANCLQVLKLSDLHKLVQDKDDDESADDSDSDGANGDDPILEHQDVPHRGAVNRVRPMPQAPHIVATMSETSAAHVFDISGQLARLAGGRPAPGAAAPLRKPIFTYDGHAAEGYACDWSSVTAGLLATGDNNGDLRVWNPRGDPAAGGARSWAVDAAPMRGHKGSVEDIQWSPTERTVLISGSDDGTVAVWDTRQRGKPMMSSQVHDVDVNAVAWNRVVSYLLATGADDGSFKVWDLRAFGSKAGKPPAPVARFAWHNDAITSLEWHPTDDSILLASGEDNQVSIWDLSIEDDTDAAGAAGAAAGAAATGAEARQGEVPAQLLFAHLGQVHVKEAHWHPQIPGLVMSTAEDGFNCFIPNTTV